MRLLLNKEHWTELALLTSARGGPCVATAVTLQLAAKSVLLTASPVAPATNLCCRRHFFARHQVLIRKARGIIFNPNPNNSTVMKSADSRSRRSCIYQTIELNFVYFFMKRIRSSVHAVGVVGL